jgi:hypothetical protein
VDVARLWWCLPPRFMVSRTLGNLDPLCLLMLFLNLFLRHTPLGSRLLPIGPSVEPSQPSLEAYTFMREYFSTRDYPWNESQDFSGSFLKAVLRKLTQRFQGCMGSKEKGNSQKFEGEKIQERNFYST